jgi:GNAT superfamily N-acetyltransferase
MPLVIRPAVVADAPIVTAYNALLALESEHKKLDPEVLAPGVLAALRDPERARYFVAEDEGAVVGQIMLTREWSDWRNGWIWWIQSVYVRSDRRRHGVFRALYEHVRKTARSEGVVGLRLYVEQENHAAQEVYKRLGMQRSGYLVLEECPI